MSSAKKVPVKIIVDVHERQSGIAETLAELGAMVEVASLPAGDYAVAGGQGRSWSARLRHDDRRWRCPRAAW